MAACTKGSKSIANISEIPIDNLAPLSLLQLIILYFFAFLFCCIVTFNFYHFLRTYCDYYRSIVDIRLYCSAQVREYSSIKPLGIIRVHPSHNSHYAFLIIITHTNFVLYGFAPVALLPKKLVALALA